MKLNFINRWFWNNKSTFRFHLLSLEYRDYTTIGKEYKTLDIILFNFALIITY